MPTTRPLAVTRLILNDIRCFEHLDISFNNGIGSAVVIGDNGDGKSTILRSLAMGICDQSSASALFRELHGEYVRTGSAKGYGSIDVRLGLRGRESFRIVTTIKSLKAFERVEQKLFRISGKQRKPLTQDEFPWHRIFASGYGPGIRVQGTSEFDSHLTVDAVYPLFRYDVLLQNPELIIRRLIDAVRRKHDGKRAVAALNQIKGLLARLLQLDGPRQISLEPTGIYVKESSGKVGLSALADGHRGMVTWVLDLVSWWFLYRQQWNSRRRSTTAGLLDVHGVVLIDEVEQHLHPRWQRNILRLLTDSFPHVQFVATTHSPLVASGCEGIPVIRLGGGTHDVIEPFGWLAEDVYEAMGVPSSRAEPFRQKFLAEFTRLDLKRLRGLATPSDRRRLSTLRRKLDRLPGTDPLRLTTEIANIRRHLEQGLKSKRRGHS